MVFKEFSRCSLKGFVLSVLAGGAVILVFAGLALATGHTLFLRLGLVIGLACARWAEVLYSRNCSLSRVGIESAVLALLGLVLITADDIIAGFLA